MILYRHENTTIGTHDLGFYVATIKTNKTGKNAGREREANHSWYGSGPKSARCALVEAAGRIAAPKERQTLREYIERLERAVSALERVSLGKTP